MIEDTNIPAFPDAAGTPPSSARWQGGVVLAALVGAAVGIPLGILALLPLYLGPFLFLLLGLIPAAVLFRFGDPLRPLSRGRISMGIAPAILLAFGMSLWVESRAMPRHVAIKVRSCVVGGFPSGYSRKAFNDEVHRIVSRTFMDRFGSSGLLGYVRWASRSGQFVVDQKELVLKSRSAGSTQPSVVLRLARPPVHRLNQTGRFWIARVAVSAAALVAAAVLQLSGLRKPPDTDETETPQETSDASASDS